MHRIQQCFRGMYTCSDTAQFLGCDDDATLMKHTEKHKLSIAHYYSHTPTTSMDIMNWTMSLLPVSLSTLTVPPAALHHELDKEPAACLTFHTNCPTCCFASARKLDKPAHCESTVQKGSKALSLMVGKV